MNALEIVVGGGPGSLARWGASGFEAERVGRTFPSEKLLVTARGHFFS